MNPTKAILPYRNDSEALSHEVAFVIARAARLGLEHRLDRNTGPGAIAGHGVWPVDQAMVSEHRERLGRAEVEERGIRDAVDERLAVHRATEGAPTLGLDHLCTEHDLTEDERLVLLIATIFAVSKRHAHQVFDALEGSQFFTLTTEDMITLLDPQGMDGRARTRLLFHRGAALVKNGLITVDTHPNVATPTELLDARVSITDQALAVMVGVPELADVEWGTETPAAT